MSTVRLRRLTADFDSLSDYVRQHPRLRIIQANGDPPERYQLEFRIRSMRKKDDEFVTAKKHIVEIALPRNYPRNPPQCRMLSPVFHPNIAPHAICVGDHWSAGESLQSIVIRIGEMLAYQVYNIKSPLNGEAARWVEENEDNLPLDRVSLLVEDPDEPDEPESQPAEDDPDDESVFDDSDSDMNAPSVVTREGIPMTNTPTPRPQPPTAAPTSSMSPESAASDKIKIMCPACKQSYNISKKMLGKNATCTTCKTTFSVRQ